MAEFERHINTTNLEMYVAKTLGLPKGVSVSEATKIETLFEEAFGDCDFSLRSDPDSVSFLFFLDGTANSGEWLEHTNGTSNLFLEGEAPPKEASEALMPLWDLISEAMS